MDGYSVIYRTLAPFSMKFLCPHLYPQLLSLVNTCHIMEAGSNTALYQMLTL